MYVAIVAAIGVFGVTIASLAFARTVRGIQRQAAREREQLINQLCNLAGKPWQPAPADEFKPEPELDFLTATPEQLEGTL